MEYLDARQIKKKFGWSRARLSEVALREEWRKIEGSRPRKYCRDDVMDYQISRLHSGLARKSGHVFRGLLRHKGGFSRDCPVCAKNTSNEGVTSLLENR